MTKYNGKGKQLSVIRGSRTNHGYTRWLVKQISFGGINFKVIRIQPKYILTHGTQIKVSRWEVRTSWRIVVRICCYIFNRIVARRFSCGQCCCEILYSQHKFEEKLVFIDACAPDGGKTGRTNKTLEWRIKKFRQSS